ncbi:MAG TPA: glycosyltransferase family 4 protein [Candidatus Acidoferrales bacterium]|nr:glycosyltransferase family 4 protein [Candidatus Acidoferrales bacterium]
MITRSETPLDPSATQTERGQVPLQVGMQSVSGTGEVPARRAKTKVCMVAYTFYERDNRVRRYAEALARRGDLVDVVALRNQGQSEIETINGVRLHRIQRRIISEKTQLSYLAKMLLFFLRSAIFLTRAQLSERYDVIHVHSLPDFEVFAAFFPKLTGSKVILDIHDIVPEFYSSKFNVPKNSLTFKLLVLVERLSIAFADHVIAANHIWEERLQERSVKRNKCSTFLNYPDTQILRRRGRIRKDNRFIIVYPGSLNFHQGVDIAIRALSLIKNEVPEAEFHIVGVGDQTTFLKSLIEELGLQGRVFLKGPVPFEEIASVIEDADMGVVPKRNSNFGNEAFSTKILEFMALGVPVIVPNTEIDRYYFNDSVVQFFCAEDERSLADAMRRLIMNPELRQKLVKNADEFVGKFTWDAHKTNYFNLVDTLVNSSGGSELRE